MTTTYTAEITDQTTDAEIAQVAFEAFATAHPHEAYEAEPARFWAFFQQACPNITREEMESLLGIPNKEGAQ